MYKEYKRTGVAEMTPWTPETDMNRVSVDKGDAERGSPQTGDMIARNSKDHDNRWLVAKAYFEDNFEEVA